MMLSPAPSTINTPLKLVAIGNSFGVRLSRPLLHKYGMSEAIIAEHRPEGLLLRGAKTSKATLEQTFVEMAAAQENWGEWDGVAADGLDKLAW